MFCFYSIAPKLSSLIFTIKFVLYLENIQNLLNCQNITKFIRDLSANFAFTDDKTAQNPYSSRFGVIEFSDTAKVSVKLSDYSRYDFLLNVGSNVGYSNGGESNVIA